MKKACLIKVLILALLFAHQALSSHIVMLNTPESSLEKAPAPKVALVLSGGGARGYAHIGVIKALEEAGIPIDLIVAASAGSIIGALYADSADADQLQAIMMATGYLDFIDIGAIHQWGGFISGTKVQQFLNDNTQADTFEQLTIPFVTVATDLSTGDAIVINSGPIAPAVNASTALPGLLKPVNLYGHTLIDGAVVEPVPVAIAKKFNPVVIIAVDVNEPLAEDLPKTAYGIYSRAYDILWKRLEQITTRDADIVIRPEVGNTSRFAIGDKEKMLTVGEAATEATLYDIIQLLKQKEIKITSP